ncbi:MAG: acyltransferase [Saprospiraceae bacterium]|nr:acyltransferase [Saprospiraceae bacterium]
MSAVPNFAPKKHFEILDGLRGVASVMVVVFHVFETYSHNNRFIQIVNHGYLAVDFFFLLSGFVVAYAYDDRWGQMTRRDFYRRRLIRLQPMVVAGSVIGAFMFYFGQGEIYPLIAETPVWKLLVVLLLGCTLLPLLPAFDIRGWQEMAPLNGPAWSLFYEYIANLLYALFVHKFSRSVLSALVLVCAGVLVQYAVFGDRGDMIGGWALDSAQTRVGLTRVLFPFFAGVLLFRSGKVVRVTNAFWWCSLLLVTVFSLPRFGGPEHLWMNGLYESACIILVFPLIVAMGAGGNMAEGMSAWICKFLGDVSYPLYIIHYPFIYLHIKWVNENNVPMAQGLAMGALILVGSLALSYALLKWYDEPVRNWLSKRFKNA